MVTQIIADTHPLTSSNPVPIGADSLPVAHNGTLALSVGSSRQSKSWKPETRSVASLYGRLAQVRRTPESLAEYRAMSRADRDNAKDVGGFVGGRLRGQRRLATAVEELSCGMLDADQATEDFLLLMDLQGYSWAAYTTHSHDPERGKYRWRVVVPYSRPVTPDEHQAITRRLASWIGLEYFDPTTHEPQRLFYWPSAPHDGPFEFAHADQPLLDVDAVLATYGDYRNVSEWPVSVRVEAGLADARGKAGDPADKPGMVGAFCRQWDVPGAIEEFLPGIYEEAGGNRYTLVAGTTRGGAVLYDDGAFLFSHHATDPCAMQLCNAWDLVRLHKFGHLDEKMAPGTPITRWPSQVAMAELAQARAEIRERLAGERLGAARLDFSGAGGVAGEDEESWTQKLEFDKRGALKPTRQNYMLVLMNDPNLAGKIRVDRFAAETLGMAGLPWMRGSGAGTWSDADDSGLRSYLEGVWGVPPQWGPLEDALTQVALTQSFHPVQDYLKGLKWDEEKRLDNILTQYLGVESTEFSRVVGRKFLISAVARVMEPGCKADHTLLLCGGEGKGKSAFPRILAGDWYSESMPGLGGGKEIFEALRGSWIIEMAEMHAVRRADVEAVKHFLTKQVDKYREAYGRHVANYPRQCVFLGTSNDEKPLVSTSGNRRFWPVQVDLKRPTSEWTVELQKNRDQLWAEAVQAYRQGETWYLSDEMEEAALRVQEEHRLEDAWTTRIAQWLEQPIPVDLYQWDDEKRGLYANDPTHFTVAMQLRDRTCVDEIWEDCLRGRAVDLDTYRANRIRAAMKSIKGWHKQTIRHPQYGGGKTLAGFKRDETTTECD